MTSFVKSFLDIVGYFFIAYMTGYSTFLFISVITGSTKLYQLHRQEEIKNIFDDDYDIPISIIVPAFNEEMTVAETVSSLLSLDYSTYEIIVVDDGSTDSTSEKLIDRFSMKPIHRPVRIQVPCQAADSLFESFPHNIRITLIKKKNGGKSDALNMGINAANFPYFICLDADSVLQYDSLKKIIHPVLHQDHVLAVGGIVQISNNVSIENGRVKKYALPGNILACMQVLEYDRSFLASRILLDQFNGSLIISGAFGLFRKDTVIAAGGYDRKTVGEDMELVLKLHEYCTLNKIPYRIRYANDAVCWTQVPEKLRELRKQRKRWHIGLFQSMYRHRQIFFNPQFGAVSFISYLYFLLYELLSPFVEVFGIVTVMIAFVFDMINLRFMLYFFLVYALFSVILSLTAFFSRIYTAELSLTFRDVVKAVALCFFELTFLRFILAWERATAFFGYRRKNMNWGKIRRQKIDVK